MSELARFFLESGQPENGQVTIINSDAHHITRVLRLQCGSIIECVDEQGLVHIVKISEVGNFVRGTVQNTLKLAQESPLNLTLFQGLAKGEKMDYVIQKAVELGAQKIVPFNSRYTVVKLDAKQATKRRTRWERIAIEASKQCGRTQLCVVDALYSFQELVAEVAKRHKRGELVLLAYEGESNLRLGDFKHKSINVSIIIGSEGGFSAEEVQELAKAGCKTISLGPRILRTETAGLVALSLLGYKWGDLK